MTIQQTLVTSANLACANGKSVNIPAAIGMHLARGVGRFDLMNVSQPYPALGNDAFTEVYFTTESGNLYKIWQTETESGKGDKWMIANVRENKSAGRTGKVRGYAFADEEIRKATLEVGKSFRYGDVGVTTRVKAILAVNASRCYTSPPTSTDMVCDIRNEFNRSVL